MRCIGQADPPRVRTACLMHRLGICHSLHVSHPGKNRHLKCRNKRSLERAFFLCGWSLSSFCLLALSFTYRTPLLSPLPPVSYLSAAIVRLPLRFHSHFSWYIPSVYSDSAFSTIGYGRLVLTASSVGRCMFLHHVWACTVTFGRTLAWNNKPEVHHPETYTNEGLFQMNFGRSQIIFPWCKVKGTATTFSESVRWPIRKYRPCLLTPESSFFCTHKKRIQG